MNNALFTTGRWLVGCLLATILGFFLGLSQDRAPSLSATPASRIQWPTDSWGRR